MALRAEAYDFLGIAPNDIATCTKITPQLALVGGKDRAIELLRSSPHSAARRFIQCYDDVRVPPSFRRILPIEAFCLAAGFSPDQLVLALQSAMRELSQFEAAATAALVHPEIVQRSSELALEGSVEHTTLNMKHMGFLPLPKGSQVQVNVNANATANSASQAIAAPSPENTIRRLVNRFNTAVASPTLPAAEPKQLPDATPRDEFLMRSEPQAAVPVDAEYESDSDSDDEDSD
jgi:hypothetical protein